MVDKMGGAVSMDRPAPPGRDASHGTPPIENSVRGHQNPHHNHARTMQRAYRMSASTCTIPPRRQELLAAADGALSMTSTATLESICAGYLAAPWRTSVLAVREIVLCD